MSNAIHTSEVLVSHTNARPMVYGRQLLIERVLAGHRPGDGAHEMGRSCVTVYKWLARYRNEGMSGLAEHPSRPYHSPHRVSVALEDEILAMRRDERRGADWIAPEFGSPASTAGRGLRRRQMPAPRTLDALTGMPVRPRRQVRVRDERTRTCRATPIPGAVPVGSGAAPTNDDVGTCSGQHSLRNVLK